MRLNPFYPFYYMLYRGQALLVMERYEESLEALRRSVAHNPEALPAHVYLAACLGLLGETGAARDALAGARRIYPDLSASWVRKFLPYKRPADSDLVVEGLRKAELPR